MKLMILSVSTGAACPHIRAGPSKHHSITPSTYFGPGVVKTIQETCAAYEPAKLFVNAALTPVQQRNLELAVGVPVLDRVGLIIDIFAQRARTREARLQVAFFSSPVSVGVAFQLLTIAKASAQQLVE